MGRFTRVVMVSALPLLALGGCGGVVDGSAGAPVDESSDPNAAVGETGAAISGSALCGIICGGLGSIACYDVTGGIIGAFFCGAASSAVCGGACGGSAGRSSRPSAHAAELCLDAYGLKWANCYSHDTYRQLCTAHWGYTSEWGHAAVSWVAAGPGGPFVISYRIGSHVHGPFKTDCHH